MSIGEIVFIGWSVLMVIISLVYFVWAWESGQFNHIEKAKFDMLEDKEPLPWPGREGKTGGKPSNKISPGEKGGGS